MVNIIENILTQASLIKSVDSVAKFSLVSMLSFFTSNSAMPKPTDSSEFSLCSRLS